MNRILDRTEKAQRLGLVMKPNSSDKRHPLGRMEQMAPDRWYWLLTRSEGETEHRLQLWAVHPDAFKEFRLMGDHGRLLSGRREKHGFDGISTDYWVQIATRAANGQFLDDEPMPSQMISIEYNTLQRTAPRNRGCWVSSVEAARRLGVSKKTLIRYINSGKVNARRIVGPGGWCYQVDMSNEPVQTQLIAQPITEAPVEPLIAPPAPRVTFVEPTPAAVPAPAPTAPANPTIAMIVRLFERLDTATQADTLQRLMEIAYP